VPGLLPVNSFPFLAQSREEPNRPLKRKTCVQMVKAYSTYIDVENSNITNDLVERTKDEILQTH
jgi:hypothetical protein